MSLTCASVESTLNARKRRLHYADGLRTCPQERRGTGPQMNVPRSGLELWASASNVARTCPEVAPNFGRVPRTWLELAANVARTCLEHSICGELPPFNARRSEEARQ